MSNQCQHGQLARVCNICEVELERDDARRECNYLRELLSQKCLIIEQHNKQIQEMCARVGELLPAPIYHIATGNADGVLMRQIATLTAQRDELLQELRYIAEAKTWTWDDPTDFEAWAKSRARFAIEKATK